MVESSCFFMSFQVIYFSRGGRTKKVVDAIAFSLNVDAVEVKEARLDNIGLIVL